MVMSNGHRRMGDNICHNYIAILVGEKQGKLEEKEVSLFIYFLIESQTCVTLIYFSEWRVVGSAFLTLAVITQPKQLSHYLYFFSFLFFFI